MTDKVVQISGNDHFVEAFLWTGTDECSESIQNWGDLYAPALYVLGFDETSENRLIVETPDGLQIARCGDWVMRTQTNEFFPCNPDVFSLNYLDS